MKPIKNNVPSISGIFNRKKYTSTDEAGAGIPATGQIRLNVNGESLAKTVSNYLTFLESKRNDRQRHSP